MWHSVLEFQLTRLRIEKSFSFRVKCTVNRVFVKGCSVSELLACYGQIRSHSWSKNGYYSLLSSSIDLYVFVIFYFSIVFGYGNVY